MNSYSHVHEENESEEREESVSFPPSFVVFFVLLKQRNTNGLYIMNDMLKQ